jgi:hypothetical protein
MSVIRPKKQSRVKAAAKYIFSRRKGDLGVLVRGNPQLLSEAFFNLIRTQEGGANNKSCLW